MRDKYSPMTPSNNMMTPLKNIIRMMIVENPE
jgi:hypothetical protein